MNVASAYKMNKAPATGEGRLFGIGEPGFFGLIPRYPQSIFVPVLYRFFPFSDIFPSTASGKRMIKDIVARTVRRKENRHARDRPAHGRSETDRRGFLQGGVSDYASLIRPTDYIPQSSVHISNPHRFAASGHSILISRFIRPRGVFRRVRRLQVSTIAVDRHPSFLTAR